MSIVISTKHLINMAVFISTLNLYYLEAIKGWCWINLWHLFSDSDSESVHTYPELNPPIKPAGYIVTSYLRKTPMTVFPGAWRLEWLRVNKIYNNESWLIFNYPTDICVMYIRLDTCYKYYFKEKTVLLVRRPRYASGLNESQSQVTGKSEPYVTQNERWKEHLQFTHDLLILLTKSAHIHGHFLSSFHFLCCLSCVSRRVTPWMGVSVARAGGWHPWWGCAHIQYHTKINK